MATAKNETAAVTEEKTIKVTALVTFYDKETKKLHKAGERFTVTEARYKEILSKGKFVKRG